MRISDYFDRQHGRDEPQPAPHCKRCGSTDVRWRQQGGRWVLFSLKPGVVHSCAAPSVSDDEFEEL